MPYLEEEKKIHFRQVKNIYTYRKEEKVMSEREVQRDIQQTNFPP